MTSKSLPRDTNNIEDTGAAGGGRPLPETLNGAALP